MLTQDVIDALLAPITEGSPCGDDLEYDPAFTALESAAQRKPEQQFGDTVIPAVEPEWQMVQEQALALLQRSKDLRVGILLLRASLHRQGIAGFVLGIRLLRQWLDAYWDHLHPALDADDDNDPTMRLNALTPLADDSLITRDFYDAVIGHSRGVGTISMRDVAIAHNVLSGSESSYSSAQVEGALQELLPHNKPLLQAMQEAGGELQQLMHSLELHSGRSHAIDVSRLQASCKLLAHLAAAQTPSAAAPTPAQEPPSDAPTTTPQTPAQAGYSHTITSRQEALQQLDRVIHFLEQTEPGNPAPLLIQRAKKLIGVSFLDIIHNLAPDAMSTIEQVTGARADAD